jgi:hypothetical protein
VTLCFYAGGGHSGGGDSPADANSPDAGALGAD